MLVGSGMFPNYKIRYRLIVGTRLKKRNIIGKLYLTMQRKRARKRCISIHRGRRSLLRCMRDYGRIYPMWVLLTPGSLNEWHGKQDGECSWWVGTNGIPWLPVSRHNTPLSRSSYVHLDLQCSRQLTSGMIHQYFRDYATHFNLWDTITFNTRVERLYRRQDHSWVVETNEGEEEFDYVCVGNGHYEDGWIPDIPNLSYVFHDL